MPLSSRQLEAFEVTASSKSFSEAAHKLSVTQSALSQRVLNLEDELQATLFIRDPGSLHLTETGENLLRYCRAKSALEQEFLSTLGSGHDAGLVKIAGFSTLMRSIALPQIGAFGRARPKVQFELLVREIRELYPLLKSGQADFILSTNKVDRQECECLAIGFESNVLIESVQSQARADVYIDHDEFDETTQRFWNQQKSKPKNFRRIFLDEAYMMIEGVEQGLGKAVVPEHLITHNRKVRVVRGLKPYKTPVYLIYFRKVYVSKLQQEVIELLSRLFE